MWNKKLKERVKELENRLEVLENPYTYKRGQKISGIKDYIGKKHFQGDLVIIDRRRYKNTLIDLVYNEYNVLDMKDGNSVWFTEHKIITKKPKKDADTKA